MDNVKITVSFVIPGSTRCIEKNANGEPVKYDICTVDTYNRKKDTYTSIRMKVAKTKPAVQTINMTDEAYAGMLTVPAKGISINHWRRISDTQKVASHLTDLQHDLGASSFDFVIYED